MIIAFNGWSQEVNNQPPLIIQIANQPLPVQVEPVNALKLLHNPAEGRLRGGLFALVAHGLVLGFQSLSQFPFGEGIDHQGKGHDESQGFDALRLFDKDATGKEERVFEEAKPSFYGLLPFVFAQALLSWPKGFVKLIGGENEATALTA